MKKILTMIIIFMTIFAGVPVNAADACYQCNGKSDVYKWGSNSDADSSCPSGYHSVSLTETQCKSKKNSSTTGKTITCAGADNIPAALPKFLSNIVNLLKIITPIILIIMGMLDFAKASISSSE